MYIKKRDGQTGYDEYINIGTIKTISIGSKVLRIQHIRSDKDTYTCTLEVHNVLDNDVLFNVIYEASKCDEMVTIEELVDRANKIYSNNKAKLSMVPEIRPGETRSRTI